MKCLIPIVAIAVCCLFIGGLILVIELNQPTGENANANSNGDNPVLGSVGSPNSPIVGSPAYSSGNIQVFLKVDGVTGESTDAKHLGWVEATAYNWTVTVPQSSSGRPIGSPYPSNFIVVAETSKASPVLFRDCVMGKQLTVTIAVQSTDGNGKAVDICTWRLGNVIMSSYNTNTGLDGGSRVYDVYGFMPGKVEVTVQQINADGSLGSPTSAEWEYVSR
ncbi:type VI secretion system tube protein Hcp [Candidatus Bathyarchaeota archaeon]|nr:type VI secretion system tube protein Hcp [Candidatus Bathyarchaeota archaeon]